MSIEQAKILCVQKDLQKKGIDGWLLYDFQKRNTSAIQFLEIPESLHLTRRLFYWIPKEGEPIKILHKIESSVLDHLPGSVELYLEQGSLVDILQKTLEGKKTIAMEYSPYNKIPAISFVDGGTIQMVQQWVTEVVSSGDMIQTYTCVLTQEQVRMQQKAGQILENVVEATWHFLSLCLKENTRVTEYDVQQFMVEKIQAQGCVFAGQPICACGSNSSNPHYGPTKNSNEVIRIGDLVLIDLWCKLDLPGAVYADITRIAVAANGSSPRHAEIFSLVKLAQQAALDFLRRRCLEKKEIKGFEMDRVARQVIEQAGYGQYFTHRTGHNIYTEDHGPGTHLDSLETWDDRALVPGTSFSIEPGIYLPEEFGVRLEYDIYLSPAWEVTIVGGVQETITTLLSL